MDEIVTRQRRKVINFNPNSKGVVLTEELEMIGSPDSVNVTTYNDREKIVITKNDD